MKFLLDMPVPQRAASWLRSKGHDTLHARDVGLAQASDIEILRRAQQESRIVVTMDLDFPRLLSTLSADGPGIILIRLQHPHLWAIQQRLEVLFKTVAEADLMHSIAVVEESYVRLHKLPIR